MEQKTSVLAVEGMTCHSCVRHVDHALREVDGVEHVDVQLREGKVVVRHDSSTELGEMIEALQDAGYPAAEAGAGPMSKRS